MGYAPYGNDHRDAGQGKVLGSFVEREYGHRFEYAQRGEAFFPASLEPDFPHVIFVGSGHARLGIVKKTVVIILCSDDEEPQKWQIKHHHIYA
jgi:hypothetical protein